MLNKAQGSDDGTGHCYMFSQHVEAPCGQYKSTEPRVKVLSVKPFGMKGIEVCREIVSSHQYKKYHGRVIDATSAGCILAVYDKLGAEQKEQLLQLPLHRVVSICWKMVS